MPNEGLQTDAALLPKPDIPTAQVAMEYLKLARTEILSRADTTNKTVVGYVAAASAVMTFFFSDRMSALQPSDKMLAIAGLLAYLSAGAMWVIQHQESMITALAKYQSEELAPVLPSSPEMWEKSDQLHGGDGKLLSTFTIITQSGVIIAPMAGSFWWAMSRGNFHLPACRYIEAGVYVAILWNLLIMLRMIWDRFPLRDKRTQPNR